MKRNRMIGAVVVTALSIVSLSQGQANRTWTGAAGDGNWNTTGNWAGGLIPTTSANLNNWQEAVIIGGTSNPSSNIPTLENGSLQPLLRVEDGRSITYQLNEGGWDGLNQVRPEGYGGTPDAVIVGANGLLRVNADSSGFISLARAQTSTTPGGYVYRVGAGGVFDLGAGRVDLSFSHDRLSHMILDGGTYQQTGGSTFFGTRFGSTFSPSVYSEVTLSNGGTFSAANVTLGGMVKNGNESMIFDLQDVGSTAIFKAGGDFADDAAVIAAFGSTFQSTTLGTANLRANQVGNVITVSVIPEPATLGLVAAFGGGILFIRRRFMI